MLFFYPEMMQTHTILSIYLCLLSAEFLFSVFLEFLNLRNLRMAESSGPEKGPLPEGQNPEALSQALIYTKDRTRFAILTLTLDFLLILLLVFLKIPGKIESIFIGISGNLYLRGIGTLFGTALVFSIPATVVSACSHFIIEERHGFNRMTAGIFLQDILKGLLLSAVLGLPLALSLIWLVQNLGSAWWVYSFLLVAFFQLLIAFLFPVLIAPLFFRFSPLEEGPLKERLQTMAEKTGFTFRSIQVIDGSRRSAHSNAFFTGFGSSKRIALFDTLMDSLSDEQIEAVVAHELGHARLGHTLRQLLGSVFFLFCTFLLFACLLNWNELCMTFGFQSSSVHALLVIALFFSSPLTFWLSPVVSVFSRRREYAADAFAQKYCGDYHPLAEGLMKLHWNNKSNPVPHRLYSFFHYSHPTITERIAAMRNRRAGEE